MSVVSDYEIQFFQPMANKSIPLFGGSFAAIEFHLTYCYCITLYPKVDYNVLWKMLQWSNYYAIP